MSTKTKYNRSKTARVRRLIEQGLTTKEIVTKLKVRPQVVYNVRYHYNKSRGLGAIAPQPAERVGTGITSALPEVPPRMEVSLAPMPPMAGSIVAVSIPTQPTLWERFKRWFTRGDK